MFSSAIQKVTPAILDVGQARATGEPYFNPVEKTDRWGRTQVAYARNAKFTARVGDVVFVGDTTCWAGVICKISGFSCSARLLRTNPNPEARPFPNIIGVLHSDLDIRGCSKAPEEFTSQLSGFERRWVTNALTAHSTSRTDSGRVSKVK